MWGIFMNTELQKLKNEIHSCNKCPRLVEFRNNVLNDSNRYSGEVFWRKPISGYGDIDGRILIIGLAPAASGANRTGRVFTGDKSSEFLVSCLHEVGLTSIPHSVSRDDGLEYRDSFITLAVKCVPPDNRPETDEIRNCLPFLYREIELMPNLEKILILGGLAFNSIISYFKWKNIDVNGVKFKNNVSYEIGGKRLFCLFHPSPRNVNTGRITREEFIETLRNVVS